MALSPKKLESVINLEFPRVNISRVMRYQGQTLKVDPRSLILDKHDRIIEDIVKKNRLRVPLNFDATIERCMGWIQDNCKYTVDKEDGVRYENWLSPYITAQIMAGDCEDFSLLLISLCLSAGIPYHRLKLCVGTATTESKSGHAWVNYLDSNDQWKFWESTRKSESDRGLASKLTGPNGTHYKNLVFTCNKKHIFDQHEVLDGNY